MSCVAPSCTAKEPKCGRGWGRNFLSWHGPSSPQHAIRWQNVWHRASERCYLLGRCWVKRSTRTMLPLDQLSLLILSQNSRGILGPSAETPQYSLEQSKETLNKISSVRHFWDSFESCRTWKAGSQKSKTTTIPQNK